VYAGHQCTVVLSVLHSITAWLSAYGSCVIGQGDMPVPSSFFAEFREFPHPIESIWPIFALVDTVKCTAVNMLRAVRTTSCRLSWQHILLRDSPIQPTVTPVRELMVSQYSVRLNCQWTGCLTQYLKTSCFAYYQFLRHCTALYV